MGVQATSTEDFNLHILNHDNTVSREFVNAVRLGWTLEIALGDPEKRAEVTEAI